MPDDKTYKEVEIYNTHPVTLPNIMKLKVHGHSIFVTTKNAKWWSFNFIMLVSDQCCKSFYH